MPTARLVGLDVARCLALLGMVAAHVLEVRSPDGDLTGTGWLVSGRASALFAVLAGVSLALMSRRTTRLGLAVRAVLVALLGLGLGELDTGVAVILTYYGLLFLIGLPFLHLAARPLLALACGWVVVAPVVSQLLRPHLPARQYESPAFDQLGDPWQLLSELLLTGYYPCVPWLAYLLLGLALGRLDLGSRAVAARAAVLGLAMAGVAFGVSRWLTGQPWADVTSDRMYGTTPTGGSWDWLVVATPHSGTPFDLLQTGAGAAGVIGSCLVVLSLLGPAAGRAVAIVFGAGAMTLTLYSLHVVMRTDRVWPAEETSSFLWHVLVLLWLGAAFVALRRRGPLEAVVGWVSAFATRWPGRCPSPSAPPPPPSGRTPPRR